MVNNANERIDRKDRKDKKKKETTRKERKKRKKRLRNETAMRDIADNIKKNWWNEMRGETR